MTDSCLPWSEGHVVINGVMLEQLASVLKPTRLEDFKILASRAHEITTLKSRAAQKEKFDWLLKNISHWVYIVNLSNKKFSPSSKEFCCLLAVNDVMVYYIESDLQCLTG